MTSVAPRKTSPTRGSRVVLLSLVALVVGTILLVVEASGDRGGASTRAVPARRTPPPWPPEYRGLAATIERLGFPAVGDESFHIHARLRIFVNGTPVEVPANIGIDAASRTMSPLHTHEPNGVIHMEADEPFRFRLADLFAVWGVAFGEGRLGPFTDSGDRTVHVLVNGAAVENGPDHVLADGEDIVVAFGEPDSFPTEAPVPGPGRS